MSLLLNTVITVMRLYLEYITKVTYESWLMVFLMV